MGAVTGRIVVRLHGAPLVNRATADSNVNDRRGAFRLPNLIWPDDG